MTDSLRDQLLGLGFKAPAKPVPSRDERRPRANDRNADRRGPRPPGKAGDGRPRPAGGKPGGQARGADRAATPRGAGPQGQSRKPRPPQGDIDLAKAFAIRAQREKDERIEAERLKQEEARLRREARAKLETFMQGKALNRPEADIARHFEYGGKIKRIHVDAEQLAALNAGELGVVQLNGRYLLVTAAVLDEAEAIFPQGVALRVDPAAPAGEEPSSDPRYPVPDDLVW